MSNKLKSNRKQQESMITAMKQFLGYLLDGIICIYMLAVIVVMPFYNEQGFAYIGTNKATFFRNLSINAAKLLIPTVVLYLIFCGVEISRERKRTLPRLSVTDIFALLYGVSLCLSYLASDYKDMALWGAEGWYMGFIPQLFLLGIYFMISVFWKTRKWMFLLFLPVSGVVFALGYLNRFGIYPIDMGLKHEFYLSTIGNINWYCGYLVSVFFGGFYLLWQSGTEQKKRPLSGKKILLVAYVAIGFATLVTQGSMSGLVTLAAILVIAFCMSAEDAGKMLMFWQGTLILSLVCLVTWCLRAIFAWEITFVDPFVEVLTNSPFPVVAVIISLFFVVWLGVCVARDRYPVKLFRCMKWVVGAGTVVGLCLVMGMITQNTLHPGSIGILSENSFFTFSPEWGSNRGATWKAGVMCFAEQNLLHRIVGVGPDAMAGFLAQDAGSELMGMISERFGTSRLTNAHCEWLTILVNEGLFGFVSFVGMIVSAIVRFIPCGKRNVIIGACGFCLLAYTVNNMFSFQQSMSVATIFVILGIGEACAKAYALYGLLFGGRGGKIE